MCRDCIEAGCVAAGRAPRRSRRRLRNGDAYPRPLLLRRDDGRISRSARGLGAAAYLLYNWLRFEDPTQFGGGDRFDVGNYFSPDLFKILGLLLISPGK